MTVGNLLREDERNRLLRRVDWRFFLPSPWPARSICFTGGILGRGVALISDQIVDTRLYPHSDCDLAVAADPDRATLRAAWSALRPGGSCYTEWRSPLAGGAQGVRRQLAAAGFETATCYWAWPWPNRGASQFWLPLEASGALRYFLNSRPSAATDVGRVGQVLLRKMWLLIQRVGLAFPICAVAHKPATCDRSLPRPTEASPADTSEDILESVRNEWSKLDLGAPPDRLSWLLLTGGQRSINKVVGLIFAEPDCQPRLVVKMARVPESIPALRREAEVLRSVQLLRPTGVGGVPRVLFCREHGDGLVLSETVLKGVPLWRMLRRDTYRDLALQATTWLADLAGHPKPSPRSAWWSRLVEPVLAEFADAFGQVVDSGMLRETEQILGTLDALPLVCEQRDFSPWNVLVTSTGELAVLDWESAEVQGLPFLDLLYFLTYLAFFLDRATDTRRYRDSYRAFLNPSTFTGLVRQKCLERYASQTGIDSSMLRPLALLVWLLHSRSEYRHLAADVGDRPSREVLRGSLFLSLWEEELERSIVR